MHPQTPRVFTCEICGRRNFITASALRRHQADSFCAKLLRAQATAQNEEDRASDSDDSGTQSGPDDNLNPDVASQFPDISPQNYQGAPPQKPRMRRREMEDITAHDLDAVTEKMGVYFAETVESDEESTDNEGAYDYLNQAKRHGGTYSDQSDYTSDEYEEKTKPEQYESDGKPEGNQGPDTWIYEQFKEYCVRSH